ncbi:hypothetical protein EXIGLDRAFT_782986 [Exidia glandulosa HHB12029]|uniref:Uncharacterized protein n=1 Tax=Exidia glandulosa HHB12029 TaxID=1314781 RepID=A0A166NBD4_EXIGL|nr:hypothetical protein EXIGLDRAFT_782986 [Exidia glandulosa HHB12029]
MSTLTTRPTAVQPSTFTSEEWKTLRDVNVLGPETEPLPPHPEGKVGHVMQYGWIYRSSGRDHDYWEDLRMVLFTTGMSLGFERCVTFRGDDVVVIGINYEGEAPTREHRDAFVQVTEGKVGGDTITWLLVGDADWHCVPKCWACRAARAAVGCT